MSELRFRGVRFEARGQYGIKIDATFDEPWTDDGVARAFPDEAITDKASQRLWGSAEYREGATRGNAGVVQVYAAVLDADCMDVGSLDALIAELVRRRMAFIAYTSWSHGAAGKVHKDSGREGPFDAFRLVLPYSRPVTPPEHQCIVPALFGFELPALEQHYVEEVRGKWMERANGTFVAAKPRGWDPASSRPAQSYFVPSPHSTVDVGSGSALDVAAILARPQTAKAALVRVHRQLQAPTQAAVGALADIGKALAVRGFYLGPENLDGWRRGACPVCAPNALQKSPSFRVRANGEAIDAHCFSQCKRHDIMRVLGLEADGRFKAPTELRALLDGQLDGQAVGESVTVEAAVVSLVDDIRDAVTAREATVIKYPAGTGKSHASAIVLAERVRTGHAIVYSTQEHVVAHETRAKLPPDVYDRSVHIHSPLVQVGDGPVCERKEELAERVFEYGSSLLGKECPSCPFKLSCEAYADAKDRLAALPRADLVFVSHAGIQQVIGTDREGAPKGSHFELIVDEMPGVFEPVQVSSAQLAHLAKDGPGLAAANLMVALAVRSLAKSYLACEPPTEVRWGPGGSALGNALAIVQQYGQLTLAKGARPAGANRAEMKAAAALIKLALHQAAGGLVYGLEEPTREGLSAMLPDACHQALLARRGTLLSATPLMPALPNFALREVQVTDGAPVRRVMVLTGRRGSTALAKDPAGMPWALIEAAIERAWAEAQRYTPAHVLFVTFKAVADAIREHAHWSKQPWLYVAHFGALRGKNSWMEGRPEECSVIYCLGTPRSDVLPTLAQLGLVGEAAAQAWRAYAAGELTQAEGRLRLPRRTKSCSVMIEGDVAPSSWTPENLDEVIELV